ncbi:N-acetylmuramoyl-L-alanine amidase [Aestuariivirga sp.]|uniref:N-acetylmuramoyl-L-alanine amidase n=1 Tax=Aestuariivirga sp. TaxID=2650926 RepID=UPI0039E25B9C
MRLDSIQLRERPRTDYIIIHDSHTDPDTDDPMDFLRVNGRRMGLLDIGYHFVVTGAGEIVETRPRRLYSSAAPGLNDRSINIVLHGGANHKGVFENNIKWPTKMSLMSLLCELEAEFPQAKIKGHSELTPYVHRKHPCPCWDIDDIRQDFLMFKAKGIIP